MHATDENTARSWSLTTRAFVGISLVVSAVVAAIVASFAVTARRAEADAVQRNLEQSGQFVSLSLQASRRTLEGGARVFVKNPNFFSLMASQQREDVLDRAIEATDQIGANWAFITDAAGVLIAKSDEPGVSGVAMGHVPLVAGALGGQIQSGFGASGDTMLFQAVALPITAKRGAPEGVLVATLVVDSVFLHDMKSWTASDLIFFTRDANGRDHPAASTIHASARDLTEFLASRADTLHARNGGTRLGDIQYLSLGTSLITAGGEEVGGFVVLRARENGVATLAALKTPLKIALVTGILVTLAATVAVSRFVTGPTRSLTAAVSRAARGDLTIRAHAPLVTSSTQELHDLSSAFDALVNDLRDKEALIAVGRLEPSAPDAPAPEPLRTPRAVRAIGARMPLARQINNPGLVFDAGSVLANRYTIHGEVGRGGLGIVYRALDRVIGETIAIKVLRPELVLADASAFEQLKIELRIARRLSHRNIVRTHDIGEADDVPFLTMEFVDGASLATIIHARGALSRAAVLAMAKQLLGALSVAHDHGVVHGDLKPQNLLIDANGLLKVTDFGVARLVRGARNSRSKSELIEDGRAPARLTGAVVGTPEYMAPEQLIGEPSSQQTDLYAAGVVLKECLTGNTSYQADTPVAFVARKLGAESAETRDDDPSAQATAAQTANGDLRAIVEGLMNPRADLRPASARLALSRFMSLD
ncbi:MAG: protein kinase [Gemmatimonas sp.]